VRKKGSELRLGRIVWTTLSDANGISKRRPAIVVTPTEHIRQGGSITVAAITTTYADPPAAHYVELPWHPDVRMVGTGLNRRSAAMLTWLRVITADEIEEYAGDAPAAIIDDISRRLEQLDHQDRNR
jgi:mRNA-degrading endonuclease toxin of MazEF toxin-antitoxin module